MLMEKIDYKYIVKLEDFFISKTKMTCHMVIEKADGISLTKHLIKNKNFLGIFIKNFFF